MDVQPQQTTAIKSLSLRDNFIWTFIGNVVYSGCQWGMLIILAKFGNPYMVGQFSLGLAVTAPVIMLTNLQLRGVQATDARCEYHFSDYLALRLLTTISAFVFIAFIIAISRYNLNTALVVIAVGLAKCFESISDIFYGLLQQHERMDRIAISMMIKGFLSLTSLGIVVYLTGSVFWGAVTLAIAWAVVLLYYDLYNGIMILAGKEKHELRLQGLRGLTKIRPRWDTKTLCRLAWLALPLGIVMMLVSLNSNIPRYFIHHYRGEYWLGIYSAMVYLMVAGNTVIGALGQSASPRLAKYYASQDSVSYNKLLWKLLGIGAVIGTIGILVAILGGKFLLSLIYTPEYAQEANVFVLLMVAAALGYVASFAGYGMTAARYFRAQLPLFVIVAIITTISAALLVPKQGLIGAALAVSFSNLVQLVGSIYVIGLAVRRLEEDKR